MKHVVHVSATIERDVVVDVPEKLEPVDIFRISGFARNRFRLPYGALRKNDGLFVDSRYREKVANPPGWMEALQYESGLKGL